MPEMDQGIKWLVRTHPEDVLALAIPEAEFLGPLPPEVVTAPQRLLDTLLRARYHGVECAVDIEAEARPQADIGRRLYEYGSRANIVTGLPVISVVLWLQRKGRVPSSPYELRADNLLLATWTFFGIEVYQLESEAILRQGHVGLLPLVPFTHNGGSEAIIERTARLLVEQAPADQLRDLAALLTVFGARFIGKAPMLSILGNLPMSTEILKESPLYQEWVRDAKEQGRAEGRAEGHAEGTEAATRHAVVTVLEGRFGTLPPELREAIASASLPTLDAVLAHAASESLAQLRERLSPA